MTATAQSPEPREELPVAEEPLLGHRPHYNVTFLFLALGGLALAVSQSLVAPALREIQTDLGTSTTAVTWVLTAFLLSASVATPILGRLGDMFGKKRVLVIALTAVAIGTFVSAIATTLAPLVVGRVIQGLGGGIFPLSMSIIRDEFPRERVAGGIALISAILGVGGGLGIVLAGPIVDHLNYHWLFWFPFIVVTIAAIGVFLVVPESPIRTRGRVDWLGALLLAGWLVALLLPISEGRSWGWTSARVLGLFAASAVIALIWVAVEIRSREPLVDMRMMRLRGVWTTNLTAILLGAGMFGSFILIPQLIELPKSTGYGFGGSVTQGGLYLLPSTVMMVVFSVVAGRLVRSVGPRLPLILGTSVSVASFLLARRCPQRAVGDPARRGAARSRDRLRVLGDGEPDRRVRAQRADGRRDGDEHDHADDRRLARSNGLGRAPDQLGHGRRPAEGTRLHARLRRLRGRSRLRRRRSLRRSRAPQDVGMSKMDGVLRLHR